MKFIVDELPSCPDQCELSNIAQNPYYQMGVLMEPVYECRMSEDPNFVCQIGKEGFICPYLKEFEAEAVEEIPTLGNSICKVTPVRLKD